MNNKKISSKAARFGINFIIRFRIPILLLTVLLAAAGFFGTQKIVMDDSFEGMFEGDDVAIQLNNKFKEIFGNEDFILVFIEAPDIFSTDTLSYMRELSDDIKLNLPFVRDITSITDIEYIDVIGGDLYVDDLVGKNIPSDKEALEEIRSKVLSKEVYLDRIVTEDSKKAVIFIEFERIPEIVYIPENSAQSSGYPVVMREDVYYEQEYSELENKSDFVRINDAETIITPSLEKIIERHNNPDVDVKKVGGPNSQFYLEKTIQEDTGRAFIIALVIAAIILITLFRSFSAVAGPVFVILCTALITFGIIGWAGITMSTFAIIIALLLLVSTVSYSIHIINHFRSSFNSTGKRLQSLHYAFEHATWPCFVTAATTAVGFISFSVLPLQQIKNMGIGASIGVLVTYILVIMVVPIILSFGRDKNVTEKRVEKNNRKNSLMSKWADFSVKNVRSTVIITSILIILSAVFGFFIDVDTDFIRMFGDRNDFIRDAKYVTQYLGGLYSYEVMIELPEDGMAKEPLVLKTLDEMDSLIHTYETTKQTTSLNNILKDINMTMNEGKSEYFAVPDTRQLIAQYLLLYEMSGGEELDNWIDYNERYLRLSVQVRRSTTDLRYIFEDIEEFAFSRLPSGTRISIAGDMPLFLKSISMLIEGQIVSILIAFVCISIMMIIILRSFKIGLLAMIPNVLPLGIVAGIMGLLDITLNLQTIVVAPLLIGIAVDDTVHYFMHFKTEFKKSSNYRTANRETFRKIGWALVFTSVILIVGFSVFATSTVNSIIQLAILIGVGIFAALAADLLITPVLFVLIKPFGKEEKPVKQLSDSDTDRKIIINN
jgi:uncharacterized protein